MATERILATGVPLVPRARARVSYRRDVAIMDGHDDGSGPRCDFSRRVTRSVVDYEDFVGLFRRFRGGAQSGQGPGQFMLLVVSGNDEGKHNGDTKL